MHLSFGDKAHILTSDFSFWIGAFSLFIGSIVASFFLTEIDFASLRFYQNSIAITNGTVAGTEATNCTEDDATIFAIYYRYQVGNRKLVGYSYSSALSVKLGEDVPLEYLPNQPEYARIVGTRNAPYALWVDLLVLIGPLTGLTITYKAFRQSQANFAIIADAEGVTATYKQTRTTNEGVDGSTVYYLVYSYQFYGMAYTCTKQVNDLTGHESDKLLFIQCSMPANAVFATDLPIAIQKRLLSFTKN